MPELRYTLLADGTSDRALMPHLTWLLQQRLPSYAVQAEMAELWTLPPSKRPKGLTERIKMTLELYRCDLLFIHRDAEREARGVRVEEIRNALTEAVQVALRGYFLMKPRSDERRVIRVAESLSVCLSSSLWRAAPIPSKSCTNYSSRRAGWAATA